MHENGCLAEKLAQIADKAKDGCANVMYIPVPTMMTDEIIAALRPTASQPAPEVVERLGRFGHHPDGLIDYEIEIDALIGMAYDRLTMGGAPDLERRIAKAMDFRTLQKPGELRWLNQVFRGQREIYAVKPAWVQWPEDALAALPPEAPKPTSEGALREALAKCRDQFEFYAKEHAEKCAKAKSEWDDAAYWGNVTEQAEKQAEFKKRAAQTATNQEFVELCCAALSAPLAQDVAAGEREKVGDAGNG